MPRQNRVQPTGDILAIPARGAFMGNRGILHDDSAHSHGQLSRRRWQHKAWVCCLLDFNNRPPRPLMRPNNYTELFFHDEAVALAAGHRPCFQCRYKDHKAFLTAADHHGPVALFDTSLHAARAIPRSYAQRRDTAEVASLPDGTFILTESGPALLWQDALFPFTPGGYEPAQKRPSGIVTVITPEPTRRALAAGYAPAVGL